MFLTNNFCLIGGVRRTMGRLPKSFERRRDLLGNSSKTCRLSLFSPCRRRCPRRVWCLCCCSCCLHFLLLELEETKIVSPFLTRFVHLDALKKSFNHPLRTVFSLWLGRGKKSGQVHSLRLFLLVEWVVVVVVCIYVADWHVCCL